MARSRNTNRNGGGFSQTTIDAVWKKGKPIAGEDSNVFRKDSCGAKMKKAAYGTTGEYGWEVDHIKPVSKGGGDELSNLQPLHWENNRGKGDDYPTWNCTRRH